jgi:hypothetical protein
VINSDHQKLLAALQGVEESDIRRCLRGFHIECRRPDVYRVTQGDDVIDLQVCRPYHKIWVNFYNGNVYELALTEFQQWYLDLKPYWPDQRWRSRMIKQVVPRNENNSYHYHRIRPLQAQPGAKLGKIRTARDSQAYEAKAIDSSGGHSAYYENNQPDEFVE